MSFCVLRVLFLHYFHFFSLSLLLVSSRGITSTMVYLFFLSSSSPYSQPLYSSLFYIFLIPILSTQSTNFNHCQSSLFSSIWFHLCPSPTSDPSIFLHFFLIILYVRAEVRQHQWFLHKLPAYLALPPDMIELQERSIDMEIVAKGKKGFH